MFFFLFRHPSKTWCLNIRLLQVHTRNYYRARRSAYRIKIVAILVDVQPKLFNNKALIINYIFLFIYEIEHEKLFNRQKPTSFIQKHTQYHLSYILKVIKNFFL
ncbi:hypothetical protein EDEG_01804 [Edhazardia aedis USNM 41457]|uniref:Uncharacterized protein n=1 Tax=Edhazardia aedis (strain USNM 41457) TaxID=1003232 RepID=J9D8R6_EDHAE|nr:hypothetical protein EDEG_01804 [Edhazardia aedis USNM 41457]|eukprot:EJW03904.1 hypothetical protein EDEG_01804 [Edhazardia aedis USNM 41457]